MINFIIDKMCNCLLNKETKLEVPTIVMKVPNNKSLAKYNTKTGWYVNWSKFTSNVEVYKLLTKHDKELQGLIAIENDISAGATHIAWAVTAPHNNINKYKTQKYLGVGGHLFAIAIKKSIETGFGGII